MIKIKARTLAEGESDASIDSLPSECPICHAHIYPGIPLYSIFKDSRRKELESIFQCKNTSCQSLFIGYYKNLTSVVKDSDIKDMNKYIFMRCAPTTQKKIIFSNEIKDVSPIFVDIYSQSLEAETMNLDQLTGIGLRKALEFLIKDFAIMENPSEKTNIESTKLSACIDKYITDINVKECAKRATWLGNDETHYIRKWETKDINDLKKLINLTVNWIDLVILTKNYIKEMPS